MSGIDGWMPTTLGDLIEVKHGWPFKSECFSANLSGLPIVVSIGNFQYTGGLDPSKSAAEGYGTIGRVFLVEGDYWPLNTTLYSADLHGNDPDFVFHTLSRVDFQKYADKAAVPGINRNHLHFELVIIAPAPVQRAFGHIAADIRAAIQTLDHQTDLLAATRDTLLPKLLSGELRIPDAERLAADLF